MVKKKNLTIEKETFSIGYYINETSRNKSFFILARKVGLISRQMYNHMLFLAKEQYRIDCYKLSFHNLVYILTNEEEERYKYYKRIQAIIGDDGAVNTVMTLTTPLESYFESISDYYKHPEKYQGQPRFPKYKAYKDFPYCNFTTFIKPESFKTIERVSQKQIFFYLVGPILRKKNYQDNLDSIKVPLPWSMLTYIQKLQLTDLRQVRFVWKSKTKLKVELIYNKEKAIKISDAHHILSIDLGIDNFATCITTNPQLQPFILDGRYLKSVNEYTNELIRPFQQRMAQLNEGKTIRSKKLDAIRNNHANKIHSIFHVYSAFLMKYCQDHDIGTIIMGQNKGWKQNIRKNKKSDGHCRLNPKSRRMFSQMPYYRFSFMQKYLTSMNNMIFLPLDESYTSQVDHLGFESIEFHPSSLVEGIKRNLTITIKDQKRKVRGLFYSPTLKKSINSDLNGAIGIMRKGFMKIYDDPLIFKQKEQEFINNWKASKQLCNINRITYLNLIK
jgi:putative transposase